MRSPDRHPSVSTKSESQTLKHVNNEDSEFYSSGLTMHESTYFLGPSCFDISMGRVFGVHVPGCQNR
jgi:hypothetical protein